MRRLISFLIKAAVSILLLYLSVRIVNLVSVGPKLWRLDIRWMGLAFFILCIQILLMAWRWQEIVALFAIRPLFSTILGNTFIGQFFGQVLPSTVGGDAARIWLLARNGAGWATASYSVLLDRLFGVAILAVLVVACLPWTFNLIENPIPLFALVAISFGTLVAVLAFLTVGLKPLYFLERWRLARHVGTASRVARRMFRSITGLRVTAISVAIHMLTIIAAWAAANATHADVSFLQLLCLVLPVMLIATIPVSIAGWGIRESTMALAFSYAGLTSGDGLIVSFAFGVANIAIGMIGGVVWLVRNYRQKINRIEPALAGLPLA